MELGLKQAEVAKRLGVSESTLWNWERNRTEPAWHHWSAITKFLGYDPLPEPQNLGERLARHRKLEGLSQREMAEKLGVDPGTLGRWERGERQSAPDLIRDLGATWRRRVGWTRSLRDIEKA